VLLVDDGEVNRSVHEELLQCEGAVVVAVVNGEQALKRVACNGADAFDTVLMDTEMPEMDGYEASQHILELAPGIPILGQMASAAVDDRERCVAVGMVDSVTRPIGPDELMGAIVRHTERPASEQRRTIETPEASTRGANERGEDSDSPRRQPRSSTKHYQAQARRPHHFAGPRRTDVGAT
jgi:CheY-like chemotaxis protein